MERNLSVSLRPDSLDCVIGNQSAVAAIKKQLSERTPTAFLFSGPPGSGKTTLALIVAKMVQGQFYGEPEVHYTNGSTDNGVDWARQAEKDSLYRPQTGKYRIVLVDEAHKLTDAAQNALLIPTERKDSATIWVFCTTDPRKLLPALHRRCFSVQLSGLTDKERKDLVCRTLEAANFSGYADELFVELGRAQVTSPGLIVMAVERYLAGMPASEAVQVGEALDVNYIDVARHTCRGEWPKVQELLKGMKTADVRGLRAVVTGYLKTMLLDTPAGPKADALTECLLGFSLHNAVEDGVAFNITVGVLCRCCRKLAAK